MENCLCGLEPKQYIKFKKELNKIQKIEVRKCPKTGFTIDSSLENYEESRDQPCEFYEEVIIVEVPEEKEFDKEFDTELKLRMIFDHKIPLITYFLADRRHETYNKLIKEIPLKSNETHNEYIERLKTFI